MPARCTRRTFLKGTLALAGAGAACRRPPAEPALPNVLWIISDQHRADVAGFAGDANARTPALDALAAQGAHVTDFYCNAPLCAPARQTILTGLYPHDHGCWRNRQSSPIDQPTVIRALNAAGYRTALVGKSHCNTSDFETVREFHDQLDDFIAAHPQGVRPGEGRYSRPREEGERDYVGGMNPELAPAGPTREGDVFYMEEHVTREALEIALRPDPRPFFVWASYLSPHPPLYPPEPFLDLFRDAELPVHGPMAEDEPDLFPDLAARRAAHGLAKVTPQELLNVTRAYYASLAWADDRIGALLAGLEQAGLAAKTLVIYTSDHGELLGQHGLLQKRALFEGATRVPCILRWPGRIAPAVHRCVAGHVDLTATLFDLVGVPAPAGLAGRSMQAFLAGGEGAWQDRALAELDLGEASKLPAVRPAGREAPPENFGWMLREGRWKYVRHNPGGAALYDLEADPGERANLLRASPVAPEHAERAGALRAELAHATPETWRYLRKEELRPNRYMDWEED